LEWGEIYLNAIIFVVFSPQLLFLIIIGVAAGIVVGALPGLSATMATALLTSLTFGWDIYPAIVLIISVWVGAVYGGNKSSILINIPGTPAALAAAFDGYPMFKLGEASYGMGVATIGSFIGGLFGAIVLAFGAPLVAKIALKFGPPEYFLLVVWGLTAIGSISGNSMAKGLLTACLGLAVSTVGLDIMYGTGRFTFGYVQLQGGIHFVPALIGAFGLAEALIQIEGQRNISIDSKIGVDTVRDYFLAFFKRFFLTLRCSILGAVIGAIPGIGAEVASIVAYDHAKNSVKNPSRPFGEGAYEGILAPQTANNSALGGALIPLLTLGIPGDAVTAVILGVLFIHGIRPGPLFFNEGKSFFAIIVVVVILAHFAMIWLGLMGNKMFASIIKVPISVLMPIVVALSVVGSFAIQNRVFDVYMMLLFGIIGYFLKKGDYPIGPLVLGIILGNMADGELRRTLALYEGEVFRAFLTRPITIILIIVIATTILSQSNFTKKLVGTIFSKFKK
jgi:putative tricarboxylic transport membrane protein